MKSIVFKMVAVLFMSYNAHAYLKAELTEVRYQWNQEGLCLKVTNNSDVKIVEAGFAERKCGVISTKNIYFQSFSEEEIEEYRKISQEIYNSDIAPKREAGGPCNPNVQRC